MQRRKKAALMNFSVQKISNVCVMYIVKPQPQLFNEIGFCLPLNGYIWIWYNHTTFTDSGTHYKGEKMYHAREGKQQIEMQILNPAINSLN